MRLTPSSKENKRCGYLLGLPSLLIRSPDTFYQVRQQLCTQLCTQCPQFALLCFGFEDSLLPMGHSYPLFISSPHALNEALLPTSRLVRNMIWWGLGIGLVPGTRWTLGLWICGFSVRKVLLEKGPWAHPFALAWLRME